MTEQSKKSLGYMHIARCVLCGDATAMAWDDGWRDQADKLRALRRWENRGDTVTKVERYLGESPPEWCACNVKSESWRPSPR